MTEINIDWYCMDCNRWLDCFSCGVAHQLLQTNTSALEVLEKTVNTDNSAFIKNKEEIDKKSFVRCWCWEYIISWNMCPSCSTRAQVYWK